MKTISLRVEGMSCGHCVKTVKDALEAVTGVQRAEVGIGRADVQVADDVDRAALIDALAREDYAAA